VSLLDTGNRRRRQGLRRREEATEVIWAIDFHCQQNVPNSLRMNPRIGLGTL
jgi:hypothetical protein